MIQNFPEFDKSVNALIADYKKSYPDMSIIGGEPYDWYFNNAVGWYPSFTIYFTFYHDETPIMPNGAVIDLEATTDGVKSDYGNFKTKFIDADSYYEDPNVDHNKHVAMVEKLVAEDTAIVDDFVEELNDIINDMKYADDEDY